MLFLKSFTVKIRYLSILCGRKPFMGDDVAIASAAAAVHTNPARIQPREADSATSTLSIHSPFFLLHFRNHLLSFGKIRLLVMLSS
jgi:hypothetical protein